MTSKTHRATRRAPKQDRSRAMVERIIAAGREVLVERGYEGASTSRIAAKADISPGSLYQYFPDKEAILAQVLDRYTERLNRRIADAFVANLDTADSVRATVEAILDVLETDVGLLRVVYEQLPRKANTQRAECMRRIDDLVSTSLLFRHPRSVRQVDAAAWIMVRAVESVAVGYILEAPPVSRDAIISELTHLVAGYQAGLVASSSRTVLVAGAPRLKGVPEIYGVPFLS
ncbi:TetR/AcrR family transcriptional regulator [Streptomyces sp. NPDC047061]|uniref:TetR/AcrR family transcriptional regulator n=1 Tax=Streptomyces sp. NPDC047061 TaxID=3154605 RepID=UPI0033EF293E